MKSDVNFLRNIILPGDLDAAKRLHAIAGRLEAAEERLAEVEADARLGYAPADVRINAPLALIQVQLKAERDALRAVLGR